MSALCLVEAPTVANQSVDIYQSRFTGARAVPRVGAASAGALSANHAQAHVAWIDGRRYAYLFV